MRPNPTNSELTNAVQAANARDAKKHEETGISRGEYMQAIETLDELEGVMMGYGMTCPIVHASLDDEKVEEAVQSIEDADYTVRKVYTEANGVETAMVDLEM